MGDSGGTTAAAAVAVAAAGQNVPTVATQPLPVEHTAIAAAVTGAAADTATASPRMSSPHRNPSMRLPPVAIGNGGGSPGGASTSSSKRQRKRSKAKKNAVAPAPPSDLPKTPTGIAWRAKRRHTVGSPPSGSRTPVGTPPRFTTPTNAVNTDVDAAFERFYKGTEPAVLLDPRNRALPLASVPSPPPEAGTGSPRAMATTPSGRKRRLRRPRPLSAASSPHRATTLRKHRSACSDGPPPSPSSFFVPPGSRRSGSRAPRDTSWRPRSATPKAPRRKSTLELAVEASRGEAMSDAGSVVSTPNSPAGSAGGGGAESPASRRQWRRRPRSAVASRRGRPSGHRSSRRGGGGISPAASRPQSAARSRSRPQSAARAARRKYERTRSSDAEADDGYLNDAAMERRKHSRGGGSRAGKTKKELFAEAARKQARAERARKTAKLCRVPRKISIDLARERRRALGCFGSGRYPSPALVGGWILLGDRHDAANRTRLMQLGVTHILNCARQVPNFHEDDFVYLKLNLTDDSTCDIARHFDDAVDFMDLCQNRGQRVLVHCVAGVSRSVTLVAAYMLMRQNRRLDEAWDIIMHVRPFIAPNETFKLALAKLELSLTGCTSVADHSAFGFYAWNRMKAGRKRAKARRRTHGSGGGGIGCVVM